MEVTLGEGNRSHFRLDVEHKLLDVVIRLQDGTTVTGILKDVSDGGIAFKLVDTPPRPLINQQVLVTFQLEERMFAFDMKLLRTFNYKQTTYYAGEFLISSKIKKSQLSLLLMKLKLMAKSR